MFLLKVFSGPQCDAALELSPGENYSMANSNNADIYLQDSMLDELAEFRIFPEGIEFTRLTPKALTLGGGEAVITGNVYPFPAFFASGPIKFAVGGADIPSWRGHEQLDERLAAIDDPDQGDVADFVGTLDDRLKHGEDAVAPEPLPAATTGEEAMPPGNGARALLANVWQKIKEFIRYLHRDYKLQFYAGLGILCILLVVIIYTISYYRKVEQVDTINRDTLQLTRNIRKIFTDLPNKYANLSIKQLEGSYLISGLIYDNNDLNELRNYFKDYVNVINFQVLTVPQVEKKIKNISLAYNLSSFNTTYDRANQELIVAGITTSDTTRINDMQIEISNQLAGVPNLRFSVYSHQQIFQDLNDNLGLRNLHLDLSESADAIRPNFLISGYLTNKQLSDLTESITALRQKYKDVMDISLNIKDSLSALPFKIYSVYTGSPAYITTLDGTVVYVGGEIGGFKIVAINDKKIVFNGKLPLEVPLSQVNDSVESDVAAKPAASRAEVLNYEFKKVKSLIAQEQQQIKYFEDYGNKISDPGIRQFIQDQIKNLSADILLKKKDLDYYNKVIDVQ